MYGIGCSVLASVNSRAIRSTNIQGRQRERERERGERQRERERDTDLVERGVCVCVYVLYEQG